MYIFRFSYLLKGMVSHDFFLPVFFMNHFSPGPLIRPLVNFIFFSRKFAKIIEAQVAPAVSTTSAEKEKMFVKEKVFPNLVLHYIYWVALYTKLQ